MERTVLTFPVTPGSSPEQIHSISDMFLARPKEYRESRNRLGITLERVYHQPTPMGDFVSVYAESRDPAGQTVGMMAMSDLAIDKDFVRLVNEIHGMDLTVPPAGPPPETIGSWVDPDVKTRSRGLAFCAPIMPGADEAGRRFATEAYETRREELTASRRALGQSIEIVTLLETPNGSITGIYIEGADPVDANRRLAESTAPFDVWFKGELAKLYPPEIDFSKPVPPVFEMFDSETLDKS